MKPNLILLVLLLFTLLNLTTSNGQFLERLSVDLGGGVIRDFGDSRNPPQILSASARLNFRINRLLELTGSLTKGVYSIGKKPDWYNIYLLEDFSTPYFESDVVVNDVFATYGGNPTENRMIIGAGFNFHFPVGQDLMDGVNVGVEYNRYHLGDQYKGVSLEQDGQTYDVQYFNGGSRYVGNGLGVTLGYAYKKVKHEISYNFFLDSTPDIDREEVFQYWNFRMLYSLSTRKHQQDTAYYPVELFWEPILIEPTSRKRLLLHFGIGQFVPITTNGLVSSSFYTVEPQIRLSDYYTIGVGFQYADIEKHEGYRDFSVNQLPYLGDDPDRAGEIGNVFTAARVNYFRSFLLSLERTFWKGKAGTILGVGIGRFESHISNDMSLAEGYIERGRYKEVLVFSNGEGNEMIKSGLLLQLRSGYSFAHFKTALHFNLPFGDTPAFIALLLGYDIGGELRK